jgi:hypothetical protein
LEAKKDRISKSKTKYIQSTFLLKISHINQVPHHLLSEVGQRREDWHIEEGRGETGLCF